MNDILYIFIAIALGYLIGKIKIKGIGLGISAILLIALVFGHFGATTSSNIKNLGLACFVTAVGYMTGPIFFENCKKKAVYYIVVGVSMIIVASVLCYITILLFDIPVPLSLGLLAGALSSTPCLGTALEITNNPLTSVGYGIAYPFGVVGVVLAVQLLSKLKEDANKKFDTSSDNRVIETVGLITIDKRGMFAFSFSLAIGLMLGNIVVPIVGGMKLSLGISGGTLLGGLLFGTRRELFNISLQVKKETLSTIRELGLTLFLAGAGIEAGNGFVETINKYGVVLFFVGMIMTIIPILTGFIVSKKVFKMELLNCLGTICGGMTSTTALGSLSELDGYEEVSAGYAATYSVALICIIIAVQIICLLCGY